MSTLVASKPRGVLLVHELVKDGKITPEQGAMLLWLRRQTRMQKRHFDASLERLAYGD